MAGLGVAVLGDTITEAKEQGGSLKPGDVRPSGLNLHQDRGSFLWCLLGPGLQGHHRHPQDQTLMPFFLGM